MSKKRKTWDANAMKSAVAAVRCKEMGYLKAAKSFGVPRSTLVDYVKSGKPVDEMKTMLGRKPALTLDIEDLLVTYCLDMEKRFYGLTAADIRRLAFQLAIRNGLRHPFSEGKASAGKKWLKGFLNRHPELRFRKPQGVSAARIKGFTRENCDKFFELLEQAFEKVKMNPAKLFNVDETGITTVQHKHTKVLSLRGKKQVGALTTSERGALVTVVTCMSATGVYVPPLLVFPRKNMKPELLNGSPPGTIAKCHPSGWIQQDIFTSWLQHFINHVKPSEDDPVVLILDGHYSHTQNVDLINIARDNYIHIVCLPPHSTHKLQPLDVAFMSPFKTYYAAEIESWLKNNPGRVVTAYQVAELMGKAYLRAASVEAAVNGFRKCGIFPLNRNVFRDDDFVIHAQIERTPLPERERSNDDLPLASLATKFRRNSSPLPNSPSTPGTSKPLVKPADISPLPSCSFQTSTTKGKHGRAAIITESPYKKELEEAMARKNSKAKVVSKKIMGEEFETKKKYGKKQFKAKSEKGKLKKVKKHVSSSSEDSETEMQFIGCDNDIDIDAEDAECPYCTNLFSQDIRGETWIRCSMCFVWCHEECAGIDKKDNFFCERCFDN